MKTLASCLLAVFLAASTFAADSSAPLFNAVLSVGKDHRFVLASPAGKVSSFLRIGESFEGTTIKSYDAKTSVLTVERDGKALTLSLVADAAIGNAPLATAATLADASAVLTAMNFEDMLDKTMLAIRKQQSGQIDKMMGQMIPAGADPEMKEAVIGFQKKMIEEMMGGISGASLKEDVAKIYAEVFSKEELSSLGAFYQSPTGKVFADKQPALSEKMNGLISTKMMEKMPSVMGMMKDFQGEMQAKRAAARAAKAAADAAAAGKQ